MVRASARGAPISRAGPSWFAEAACHFQNWRLLGGALIVWIRSAELAGSACATICMSLRRDRIHRRNRERALPIEHRSCRLSFPQRLSDTRNQAAKKPSCNRQSSQVGLGVPFSRNGKCGAEGEGTASPTPSPPASTAQRLLSEKTARMGDKAKPPVFVVRRLCCVNSAFLCWPSLREIPICDQIPTRLN
jgi:hypothetical protein